MSLPQEAIVYVLLLPLLLQLVLPLVMLLVYLVSFPVRTLFFNKEGLESEVADKLSSITHPA